MASHSKLDADLRTPWAYARGFRPQLPSPVWLMPLLRLAREKAVLGIPQDDMDLVQPAHVLTSTSYLLLSFCQCLAAS